MTAPAEDPRGGEGHAFWVPRPGEAVCAEPGCGRVENQHPPAAGRGDTDSGGEASVCKCPFGGCACDHTARRVDPAEIVRQRSLGWPDMHPEDNCHTCGRPNPVWFADTAEWQTATDSTGDGGGILCPSCFCALWTEKTGKTAIIWRLSIGGGRDARPAGDRAQPTEELREAIAGWLFGKVTHRDKIVQTQWPQLPASIQVGWLDWADELLTGPLAALLDTQAAMERVRVRIDHPGLPDATCRKLIRRALGGTT